MYVDMPPSDKLVPLGPPSVGGLEEVGYTYSFPANFQGRADHLKRCGANGEPTAEQADCANLLGAQQVGYWYGVGVGVVSMVAFRALARRVYSRARRA